jgi:RNA chaperone Hfq
MSDSPVVTPPRPRRYSRAFHEPPLTAVAARTAASPPTPEAFYFEKQMQQQTPLTVLLEDGEQIDGVLEWYDSASLKLRHPNGARVMVYKHAIKYLYKQYSEPHAG